jgi:hypothetical protein
LAIGANAVVFSVLNALVLRPLNVPHPENLFMLERPYGESAAHSIKVTSFGSIKDRIHLRRPNRHLHFSLATRRRTILPYRRQ